MTRRMASLRRLQHRAQTRQAALRTELRRCLPALEQQRAELRQAVAVQASMIGPQRTDDVRTAAQRGHAWRYGQWLQLEVQRLRGEIEQQQGRLAELRATEAAAAQEVRVLERFTERLELVEARRRQRIEQELLDHHAMLQREGRLT